MSENLNCELPRSVVIAQRVREAMHRVPLSTTLWIVAVANMIPWQALLPLAVLMHFVENKLDGRPLLAD